MLGLTLGGLLTGVVAATLVALVRPAAGTRHAPATGGEESTA